MIPLSLNRAAKNCIIFDTKWVICCIGSNSSIGSITPIASLAYWPKTGSIGSITPIGFIGYGSMVEGNSGVESVHNEKFS